MSNPVVQKVSDVCNKHVESAKDKDLALSQVLFGLADTLGSVIGMLPQSDRAEVLAVILARVGDASIQAAQGHPAAVPEIPPKPGLAALPALSLEDP